MQGYRNRNREIVHDTDLYEISSRVLHHMRLPNMIDFKKRLITNMKKELQKCHEIKHEIELQKFEPAVFESSSTHHLPIKQKFILSRSDIIRHAVHRQGYLNLKVCPKCSDIRHPNDKQY